MKKEMSKTQSKFRQKFQFSGSEQVRYQIACLHSIRNDFKTDIDFDRLDKEEKKKLFMKEMIKRG